jgi:hypothetical protein
MKTAKAHNAQLTGEIELKNPLFEDLEKYVDDLNKQSIKDSIKFLRANGYEVKKRKK